MAQARCREESLSCGKAAQRTACYGTLRLSPPMVAGSQLAGSSWLAGVNTSAKSFKVAALQLSDFLAGFSIETLTMLMFQVTTQRHIKQY